MLAKGFVLNELR